MPLKLKSGFMTSDGNEGRLLMDSGIGDQVVLVTRDALETTAIPPRADEFRLQEYLDLFGQIASDKFDRKEFDAAGHIRVTSEDIRTFRSRHAR